MLAGIGFAFAAAVSLTVQSLTVRLGTKTHSVTDIVAVMFGVNLVVLLPVAAFHSSLQFSLTPRAVVAFGVAGLVGSLAARFAYFVGIARLGASRAEPLKALFPVVAVGIAILVLGERLTTELFVGTLLLVGGGVGVAKESKSSTVTTDGRRFWTDLGYPLAAAVLLGVDPVFTKVGFAEGTPALVGVAVRMTAAAGGFVLVRTIRARQFRLAPTRSVNRWLIAAALANTAYLLTYYQALEVAPVSVVTPLLAVSTLLVVVGSAIFLRREERVTWQLLGAAIAIVAGVMVVVQA